MASTGSRNDPLASFNFIVKIENMELGFSEVGGIGTETNIIEYREGYEEPRMRKIPGQGKNPNINFKRGFTTNGKELWLWRKTVLDGKTQRKGGTITLLDEARKPALVWEFSEAWPSKWNGPALNAKNNDIAIEEMELAVERVALQT
jgi:phage tail-like protein